MESNVCTVGYLLECLRDIDKDTPINFLYLGEDTNSHVARINIYPHEVQFVISDEDSIIGKVAWENYKKDSK